MQIEIDDSEVRELVADSVHRALHRYSHDRTIAISAAVETIDWAALARKEVDRQARSVVEEAVRRKLERIARETVRQLAADEPTLFQRPPR